MEHCADVARSTWPHARIALEKSGWSMSTVFLDGDGGALDLVCDGEVAACHDE